MNPGIQTFVLIAAGAALLRIARLVDRPRRALAIGMILGIGTAALLLPLPSTINMGDYETYVADRNQFVTYSGVDAIRFEAHLSHAILGRLDALLGATETSPRLAFAILMRAATIWFVVCALGVGFLERWSAHVVRYVGLATLAPVTLMYFGYRELGYLSLSLAVFPLAVRGLLSRDRRLDAGSALSGLGAALHGFGVVALAGIIGAALAVPARLDERGRWVLTAAVWGAAAYLGWVAVYVIVLNLPITPGHAAGIPWRPWFTNEVTDRVNVAILSRAGLRDLAFSAWVVGVPLLWVVLSLWSRWRDEARAALGFAVPSLAFLVMFWPIQGLGFEMDLVFAAFPAVYALAWVCARQERHTIAAAVLLASGHLAFWQIVGGFVNATID